MQQDINIQTQLTYTAIGLIAIITAGIALWKSANVNQKPWFIAVLILATVPPISLIINIAYLFFFAKKKLTLNDLKFWKPKT